MVSMFRYNYIEVANPNLVYIGFEHRSDFDLINAPVDSEVDTPSGGRVITKIVKQESVEVFFQYWLIPENNPNNESKTLKTIN